MRSSLSASWSVSMLVGRKWPALPRVGFALATALLAITAVASSTNIALADEDGVSFWIPGFFGSLAAAPQQPGWSLASILYNTNVSASGNAAIARDITIGNLFKTTVNISGNANVHSDATIGFVAPSYVFATPFLGGQASATLLVGYGNNNTSLNGTVTATNTSVLPLSITRSFALEQDTMGFTDLVPQFADRWNAGVNNYMVYLTGDIPVGLYSSSNLAISVSAMAPSTAASATPISIRRPATNSRPCWDLPEISRINRRDIPAASIPISIGAHRSF